MHPDLSPHLHTPECLEIINKLKECRKQHPLHKFLGVCNELDYAMNKCLKNERLQKRAQNKIKSQQMIERSRKAERDLSFLEEDKKN